MSEPIRVLHMFGALNPGGVETFVMNLYRCIDREKVQFDFALTQGKKSFFDEEALSLGARLFYYDTTKGLNWNLKKILRENPDYAAVHCNLYFYAGIALRTAKKFNVPVRIAHAHNTSFGQVYTIRRRAYEWVMRKLILKHATHMFGCSIDACEFVFGAGIMNDARCRVVHNGFDVEAYLFDPEKRAAIRMQYGIGNNQFVVGHVGRFEEQKNHTQLVEQFASLHRKDPNAVLLMVGRGSLMDGIKEKCVKLGILDHCIFAGAQKDTPSYYSAMDVFLFPSLYEGLGSVLIEAQANGLPVITSKTVVPDAIDVTGGATFVPLEAGAEVWADAVLAAHRSKEWEKCNWDVLQLYDMKKIAAKLESVYLQEN